MRRRRLGLLAALAVVGAGATMTAQGDRGQPSPEVAAGGERGQPAVPAYLVATGIFAVPPAGQGPPEFLAAQAAATAARSPLAFTIWTDQQSFEDRAWRDLLQVGRLPMNRPPGIDFMRYVAVLAWPVAGQAPPDVLRAPGLTVRGAVLQHTAVELRVGPYSGGPAPATPAAGGVVAPYALATIPRSQWPVPAPPPTVPPLAVALAP